MGGSAFPALLKASLKSYYRNRIAIFFSLFLPLMIMVIFGLLNLGGNNTTENVGIVDQAHNDASKQVIDNLGKVSVLKVQQGDEGPLKAKLQKGDLALVVILPKDLGAVGVPGAQAPAKIPVFGNAAKPQDTEIARSIVQQFFDQQSFAIAKLQPPLQMAYQDLQGRNQTYTDFLVPGIIALSIMQTGIFSVAFAFVQQKQNGVLRRLMATPMRVSEFLAAQVSTRLIMAAVQVVILLVVGLVLFHFHLAGNVLELMVVAVIGSAIFIAMGFAISGYAKDEQVVPAIANIIVLPMMFLSGIFFGRDNMPAWLHAISNFLPLTYVTDAIRTVSLDGSHLWDIKADLLGMVLWLVIATAVAVRLFRWEPV
ncbi:MAG: ABC transporter permease [Candidatus Dormiibacterota bacterium]